MLKWILYTNIWVATCFAVLVFGICIGFRVEDAVNYTLFSFFGTLAAYQLHRFLRIHQYQQHISTNARLTWMLRHKLALQVIFVIAVLGTAYFGFELLHTLMQFIVLGISGLIVLLYAFPLPFSKSGIRQIPYIKIILISLVWTIIASSPLLEKNSIPSWWLLTTIFFTTFLQIIPFDIRDLPVDDGNMHTIPQLFGATGSRMIASSGILLLGVLLYHEAGFHWSLLAYWGAALLGYWIPIRPKTLLFLEFLWETPLLFLGIFLTHV